MNKITLTQAGLFAALVAGAPFAFAGGDKPDPDPVYTDWHCVQQWNDSSASRTCSGGASVEAANLHDCTVRGYCRRDDGRSVNYTYATVTYYDTQDLVNCNGHLKVGRC